MGNKKYIYIFSEQNSSKIYIGITRNGKRDYYPPKLIDNPMEFNLRKESCLKEFHLYLFELLENGYLLSTPKGLLNLLQTKKYLGIEDIN